MKNHKICLLPISCLFLFSVSSFAANRYWTGLVAGNWNSTLNWSASSGGVIPASVPGINDIAIFDGGPLGLRDGNCTINANVSVAGIRVSSDYDGTISQGSYTITVSGDAGFGGGSFTGGNAAIRIGGTFTLSATSFTSTSATMELDGDAAFTGGSFAANNGLVKFGGAAAQAISGTIPAFYNLEFQNSGSGVTLMNTVSVTAGLTMMQGNINLNGNAFILGSSASGTGTLFYTSGSMYGAGSFTRWFNTTAIADGSTAGLFPMGTATEDRPFYISDPLAPASSSGTITVSYADAVTNTILPGYYDGIFPIVVRKNLYWTLSTGNGLSGGTYNLDARGSGLGIVGNVNDLRITLANGVAGSPGGNSGSVGDPQINRTGLTMSNLNNSFYVASVNITSSPLPVTFLSFSALPAGNQVVLTWSTTSEINNSHFIVQRSKDAEHWENMKDIPGVNNNETIQSYSTNDLSPYRHNNYYRLEQVDMDGRQTYSETRKVDMEGQLPVVSVYPNPTTGLLTILFSREGSYEINFFTSSGQAVGRNFSGQGNRVQLNISGMAPGIYFLHLRQGGEGNIRKVVVR
ncbi:MAG TPA: T9SS type A sorting domain-containing protein [Puia sp.]|nr:T9SS type A sorting domain-containing protein [Puia sp.]